MRHYCSLADSKYLPQLLALYESLLKHSSEPFMIYVLAMDEECYRALQSLSLPHMEVIELAEFEELMFLKKIRASRTWTEYCWTLSSVFTECLLRNSGKIDCTTLDSTEPEFLDAWIPNRIPEITYLDADCLFFSDPKAVFDEIGARSIAITPHRLIPSKKHLERNGLFNVGWVTFKNTEVGRKCLSRWAAQTRERCSADYGCGDQYYLNEWPALYGDDLCIIENIGVNAGPWSIGNWKVTEGPRLDGVPLVLYHAHEYIHDKRLTNYDLRPEDIQFIYKPYVAAVEAAVERVKGIHLPA